MNPLEVHHSAEDDRHRGEPTALARAAPEVSVCPPPGSPPLHGDADTARDILALLERIDALQGLLVSHRIGKPPTEKLWKKLDRSQEAEYRIRARYGEHNDGRDDV